MDPRNVFLAERSSKNCEPISREYSVLTKLSPNKPPLRLLLHRFSYNSHSSPNPNESPNSSSPKFRIPNPSARHLATVRIPSEAPSRSMTCGSSQLAIRRFVIRDVRGTRRARTPRGEAGPAIRSNKSSVGASAGRNSIGK